MKVLLVEDDEYKAADLARIVEEAIVQADIMRAASVTSALRAISSDAFSLVVLDMSLPTFDLSGPGGGGSPLGQGGVDVLRLARRLGRSCPIVVVTQYPDIEIDGKDVELARAAKTLSEKFKLNVVHCVLYEFDRTTWRSVFYSAITTPFGK